jgi:DnaJ homolog subfamily C member 3
LTCESSHSSQLLSRLTSHRRSASLNPSAANTLLRLARLNYLYLGEDSERGLQPIKQCLHYDPDSKPCKVAFRAFRALEKDRSRARNHMESGQWRAAAEVLTGKTGLIEKVRAAIADAVEQGDPDAARAVLLTQMLGDACKALVRSGNAKTATATCEELLKRDPDNVDGLVARGEDLIRKEEYEEAVRVLTDAFEKTGRSSQDVLDRVQNAQKLLKRSKQKDYYKVLDIPKDADERTIKRAYRRMTIKYHPDKPGGSEKKMSELNQAYEVLSKPGLSSLLSHSRPYLTCDPSRRAQSTLRCW